MSFMEIERVRNANALSNGFLTIAKSPIGSYEPPQPHGWRAPLQKRVKKQLHTRNEAFSKEGRSINDMEARPNAETKAGTALKAGQLWKTDNGCILITEQDDRIIRYRKLRHPEQRVAITNLIRPEALARYLHQIDAVLQN
jgi:hypothetical protein